MNTHFSFDRLGFGWPSSSSLLGNVKIAGLSSVLGAPAEEGLSLVQAVTVSSDPVVVVSSVPAEEGLSSVPAGGLL